MLRRYLDNKKVREVPHAYGQYTATTEGKLFKDFGKKEIVPDDEGMVEITIIGKLRKVHIDWVMALTFKPLQNSLRFAENWTVERYNGEKELTYLESLIWIPPLGGQPCFDKPGFNIIPGYTTYSISKEGVIWNRIKGKYIKSRKAKPAERNSYVNFNPWLDGSSVYGDVLGVHRAIGLAWLPFGANVIDMTVNHIDGDKGNNVLSNLAWATYSENNSHAMDTGLRLTRREMFIKDYLEGTVTGYNSLTSAAKAIGVTPGHLRTYIARHPDILISKRYYALYNNNDGPLIWPERSKEDVKKDLENHLEHKKSLFCCAIDAVTGKEYMALSPVGLREFTGLSKEEQRTAINTTSKWPYKGWYCWLGSKPKEVYKIPPEVAERLKAKTAVVKRIDKAECVVYLDDNQTDKEPQCLGNTSDFTGSKDVVLYRPVETVILSL